MWTSGNRVFWCDNIPLLKRILTNWGNDWYEGEITDEDKKSIGLVQNLISEIIEIEMKEYGAKWRLN